MSFGTFYCGLKEWKTSQSISPMTQRNLAFFFLRVIDCDWCAIQVTSMFVPNESDGLIQFA